MPKTKSRTGHIKFSEWFPANDPIATSMARLCILREDLYLELRGMVREDIPTLDACSGTWREIYFFRNLSRTILEIRSAIEVLSADKSFQKSISKELVPFKESFDQLPKLLTQVHPLVKRLRNEAGGHLKMNAIEEALKETNPNTKGLLQIGPCHAETHYKFSLEILGALFLRHVPHSKVEEEWIKTCDTLRETGMQVLKSIDKLFVSYTRIRNLKF